MFSVPMGKTAPSPRSCSLFSSSISHPPSNGGAQGPLFCWSGFRINPGVRSKSRASFAPPFSEGQAAKMPPGVLLQGRFGERRSTIFCPTKRGLTSRSVRMVQRVSGDQPLVLTMLIPGQLPVRRPVVWVLCCGARREPALNELIVYT